jgi:signal transduction histidine kinase
VFRFVQEGLNNAFRHAAGASQYVSSTLSGTLLSVAVANDAAAAVQDDAVERDRDRLGLQGLRHRIESLGGAFTAEFRQSGETRISMSLELVGGLLEH